LGRLQYQYGQQHGDPAGHNQHYDWFWWRRHEPGPSGDPGPDHSGAEHSVGDPAGHFEVILRA
jgi:hypothetical protein